MNKTDDRKVAAAIAVERQQKEEALERKVFACEPSFGERVQFQSGEGAGNDL